jgi:hypothetical protein
MVERRRHKRYPMPRGTFVILRNELDPLRNHMKMSIGEIAMVLYKSRSELLGQVTDLSPAGVRFDCDDGGLPVSDTVQLDLLMAEKGIYLHNIPYATIPADPGGRGSKKTRPLRSNALRFKKLDNEQKKKLQELLAHHVGSSEEKDALSGNHSMQAKA